MLVNEKTRQLKETTIALVNSLESAGLYNDEDTGNHNTRLAEYSAILADIMGCSKDFVKRVKLWAPLHDVGKVGIQESILKKPGKLTIDEFEIMKQHVAIGFKMLDHPAVDTMAKNIILYHHEKWNSKGYLHNLSKEKIPLEARIVSLADVYDALTQRRVYKEAFSEEKSRAIITEENGISFDPGVVDAYLKCASKMQEIRMEIS
jgi:response regulator RpfG family c-di-GMP phosphodiesterase